MAAFYSRLSALCCCALVCGYAWAEQRPVTGIFREALADVKRMELDSNSARRVVLESMLNDRGIRFEAESFQLEAKQDYPRTEGTNLVVTLGSGERDIVVGAHYDAAWLPDGTLSRGAIDNASSTIILVRLAETLKGEPLRHRIRIVFFDMEEIGLLGSRSYIGTHGEDSIASAINLDINGYGDRVFFGPSAAEGNELLHQLFKETCVGEKLGCQEFERYPTSDYRSFQRAGIPNLSISVLPAIETHQLWLFLNSGEATSVFRPGFTPRVFRIIHSFEDTSALVEPSAMELGYRAVLGLVRRLDRAAE